MRVLKVPKALGTPPLTCIHMDDIRVRPFRCLIRPSRMFTPALTHKNAFRLSPRRCGARVSKCIRRRQSCRERRLFSCLPPRRREDKAEAGPSHSSIVHSNKYLQGDFFPGDTSTYIPSILLYEPWNYHIDCNTL